MPPVSPKDAKQAIRGLFTTLTTLMDFADDMEQGKPLVDAIHRATKKMRKRGRKAKKISVGKPRHVDVEVIDVKGETVR